MKRVLALLDNKQTKGFLSLGIVVAIWVASGYLAQVIFKSYSFNNSVAVPVYSMIIGLILLMPLSWRKLTRDVMPSPSQVGILGLFWLCAQIPYFLSLQYTSVPTNMAISATSTVFTFVFSMLVLKYSFRVWSAVGLALNIAGSLVIVFFNAEATGDKESGDDVVKETIGGIIFAISAAISSGLFSCMFKKWVKREENSGIVFGCFGFVGILIGIPCILICHFSGLQEFQVPGWEATLLILTDAFMCSVICNFFFSKAFVYLTPVIVQVGLTTTIPVSFVITGLILKTHSYPALAILGILLICAAVLVVSFDQARYEKILENKSENDCVQNLNESEMKS